MLRYWPFSVTQALIGPHLEDLTVVVNERERERGEGCMSRGDVWKHCDVNLRRMTSALFSNMMKTIDRMDPAPPPPLPPPLDHSASALALLHCGLLRHSPESHPESQQVWADGGDQGDIRGTLLAQRAHDD
ncbi:hypothetical protein WMY93_030435 [Mugilogobius chulae]|uniref:Uncharacterized protein n=1 Tax=Mugilogobius chulae TaxID=88201 RepID=A0AAW0MK93_9GOBI